jgi:acetyl-CoA synthetase
MSRAIARHGRSGSRAGREHEGRGGRRGRFPHDIKGQGIYAYVTLKIGETPTDALAVELQKWVGKQISPIARPDVIQFAPGLPKTRSGKIMRRILRKIAEDDVSNLGDTTTLADPSVVHDLVKNRKSAK